jgi:Ca2+-binding EF-hand superfamily protein
LYSDDEIEKIFKGIDIDGNGAVHYFEFLAASMEAHGFINEERLADAFDTLDADGSRDYVGQRSAGYSCKEDESL